MHPDGSGSHRTDGVDRDVQTARTANTAKVVLTNKGRGVGRPDSRSCRSRRSMTSNATTAIPKAMGRSTISKRTCPAHRLALWRYSRTLCDVDEL